MRPVLILLVLFFTVSSAEIAKAQQWCSVTSNGTTNCTFGSIEKCRTSIAGTGGSCMPAAPVGHMQPRSGTAGSAPRDDKLDAVLDRANRKGDALIICRGC
jgi:hypothetical protein